MILHMICDIYIIYIIHISILYTYIHILYTYTYIIYIYYIQNVRALPFHLSTKTAVPGLCHGGEEIRRARLGTSS